MALSRDKNKVETAVEAAVMDPKASTKSPARHFITAIFIAGKEHAGLGDAQGELRKKLEAACAQVCAEAQRVLAVGAEPKELFQDSSNAESIPKPEAPPPAKGGEAPGQAPEAPPKGEGPAPQAPPKRKRPPAEAPGPAPPAKAKSGPPGGAPGPAPAKAKSGKS